MIVYISKSPGSFSTIARLERVALRVPHRAADFFTVSVVVLWGKTETLGQKKRREKENSFAQMG